MGALKVILIILGIIVLVVLAVGIYFYYFHVFKTIRVCIGSNATDTNFSCSSNEECMNQILKINETRDAVEKAPEFAREKINELFSKAVYCDRTCRMRGIRGVSDGIGEIARCEAGEEEVLWQIHGKEALKLIPYMKETAK